MFTVDVKQQYNNNNGNDRVASPKMYAFTCTLKGTILLLKERNSFGLRIDPIVPLCFDFQARQKLKSDYPPSPYNDVQDCDVLSKSYRNYLNLGDTDSYDGLYMLPHGAYGSKGKVKTDEDSGDVKNDGLGDSDTGDAENMQTNGEVSEDTEESCKGKELVEKEKWEVTPVSTAQEGSSGSKSKS